MPVECAPTLIEDCCECRRSVYGHIGDGNLHYNLLAPDGVDAAQFKHDYADALSTVVHDLAADMGGSFSAEHGVGIFKKPYLERYRGGAEIELMRSVKRALDPNNTLNPDKVI